MDGISPLVVHIHFWVIVCFLCQSCGSNPIATEDVERPNVVWLVCEDQSPYWFPFYGDSTVHLPHLERLAREGVVYDNAYAPVPVCSPARSSIITGMYPTTLGTHNMRSYNPYRKGENQPELNIPSYSAIAPIGVKPFTEYLRASGYYCSNNAKEDYNFEKLPSMWDESGPKAHWRNREEDQPFFSVFNFNVTHESVIWHLGNDSLFVDPDEIPIPPHFPDDPVIRHDFAVNYSNLVRMDRAVGKILRELESDNLLDNTVVLFYSDHGGPFPRHKRSLYETGTRVPLIVRYPDQKEANTRTDRMVSFIDLAPSVLSLANLEIPTVIQGKAFLGLEGVENEEAKYLFATSDRFDEQYDQRRTVRDTRWKYIRNKFPDKPYAIPVAYRLNMPMMNRLLEMKEENLLHGSEKNWLRDTKPQEELYDLEIDPWEQNNLIGISEYALHHRRLSERLDQWISETNDLGRFDEQELIKRWRPEGVQQVLPAPEIQVKDGKITLTSDRSDATLIWKAKDQSSWNIYNLPFEVEDSIQVQQVRIGFQSEVRFVD